jgi:hypothetical protein
MMLHPEIARLAVANHQSDLRNAAARHRQVVTARRFQSRRPAIDRMMSLVNNRPVDSGASSSSDRGRGRYQGVATNGAR